LGNRIDDRWRRHIGFVVRGGVECRLHDSGDVDRRRVGWESDGRREIRRRRNREFGHRSGDLGSDGRRVVGACLCRHHEGDEGREGDDPLA